MENTLMRKLILMLVLAPVMTMAQSNSGMSAEMMEMMEKAQKAQACMQNIDTAEMEKLMQEGEQKKAEVESLCAAGKRDEAQQKAIDLSREMMDDPAMVEMRKCSELMRGMIPEMPFDNFEEKLKNKNICDELK
jgi:hypothetical protein